MVRGARNSIMVKVAVKEAINGSASSTHGEARLRLPHNTVY